MRFFLKLLWNGAAVGFFVVVYFWSLTKGPKEASPELSVGICKVVNIEEIPSPTKKWKATLSRSDCGAFSSSHTLLTVQELLGNTKSVGVFGIEGRPDGMVVRWDANAKLIISNFNLRDVLWFKQDYSIGVTIELQPRLEIAYHQ